MDTSPTNHGIEDRLRAYVARRRRQIGEPFMIPPQTRRTLHAEVERKYRRSDSSAAHPSAWLLWLKFKPVWFAATAVIFLGVAAVLVRLSLGPERVRDVARTEPQETPLKAVSPPAVADSMRAAPESTRGSANAPASRQLAASRADADLTTTQSIAPTMSAQKLGGVSQRFVQMQPAQVQTNQTKAAQQPRIILEDFHIEVADGKLRLLDSDGSVYEAGFASAAQPSTARTAQIEGRFLRHSDVSAAASAPPATAGPAPATGAFSARARMQAERGLPSRPPTAPDAGQSNSIPFLALGTNRTLNQKVVVQGNIVLPKAHSQQLKQHTDMVGADSAALKALLQNATVQARVLIDSTNQFELNAAPR